MLPRPEWSESLGHVSIKVKKGGWEMHEMSKHMKIFEVFMFQRAKEMLLGHECYFLQVCWWKWREIVYFTGCWVVWGQNGTDLHFTPSQLNTSLCNGAQGDEPSLWSRWIHQAVACVTDDRTQCEHVWGAAAVPRVCACVQLVCKCMCKQAFMHMCTIADGWFYFCWLCNTFHNLSQVEVAAGFVISSAQCCALSRTYRTVCAEVVKRKRPGCTPTGSSFSRSTERNK